MGAGKNGRQAEQTNFVERIVDLSAQARVWHVRSSRSPSGLPALENGGHGTPPARRSTPRWGGPVELPEVAFDDVPCRPVQPQGGAGRGFDFDEGLAAEAGRLHAKGLPAGPGAHFERGESGVDGGAVRHAGVAVPVASIGGDADRIWIGRSNLKKSRQ
jgi:hypothetical protein